MGGAAAAAAIGAILHPPAPPARAEAATTAALAWYCMCGRAGDIGPDLVVTGAGQIVHRRDCHRDLWTRAAGARA